jgi:hypothetical protein
MAAIKTVSNIMLRHASLWTTQRYLGEISDEEALKGFEYLYGSPKTYALFSLGLFVSENLVKLLVSPLMDTVF